MTKKRSAAKREPPHQTPAQPRVAVIVATCDAAAMNPWTVNLVEAVERGVRLGGAAPVRVAVSGSVFSAPARDGHSHRGARRDLIADEVECLAMAAGADGLALVGDRNDASAGLLLGAARLNKPAVFVPADGSSGVPAARRADPLGTLARELAQRKPGPAAWPASDPLRSDDYPSHAVACLAELMGVAFPGSSTAATGSAEQFSTAQAAGRRVVELVAQNFTVRRVLLINAFTNAARLDAAFGGWTESVVFLMALAHESGVKLSIDAFSDLGETTPLIFGGEHGLADLHAAGGIPAALAALKGEWSPHSTVSGRGVNELAKTARVKDGKVLRARAPYRRNGGLAVLRGNLARQGAIFRRPAEFAPKLEKFSGVARVFDSREDALNALLERRVKKGDLVVVRYEGARGGPGLRPLGLLPRVAEALGLGDDVAFLADGIWDAALPSGLALELATPEATEGSTLSILRDGDRVDIDVAARLINAHLTETDTKIRLARWQAPASRAKNGYLARYARSVSPALEGAVLR